MSAPLLHEFFFTYMNFYFLTVLSTSHLFTDELMPYRCENADLRLVQRR